MKASYWCSLLVLVVAIPTLVFSQCQLEELQSHPDSCDKYLKCDNGVFVEMVCSPGLYFNPEENVCDWSENVACAPAPETPPSECQSEELQSHPDSCDKYLKCDNGVFVEMVCSPGLYFNPEENVCDWSENVACAPAPETPPSECQSEELQSHPDSCNKYLKCDNGVFVEMVCSPGLYFNPEENVCDWSENVACAPAPETPPIECQSEELQSHPDSCDKYLKCDNGVFVEMVCSPGLYFNPEENVCDWSENVACAPAPETPPSECEAEELQSHPDFCDKYLKCDNGVFLEMVCSPGLYFNPEENVCDWSENVACAPAPAIPPSECEPEELQSHPDFCDKYLMCDNGIFVEMLCYSGLYFNPENNVCDWPQNVACVPTF